MCELSWKCSNIISPRNIIDKWLYIELPLESPYHYQSKYPCWTFNKRSFPSSEAIYMLDFHWRILVAFKGNIHDGNPLEDPCYPQRHFHVWLPLEDPCRLKQYPCWIFFGWSFLPRANTDTRPILKNFQAS